MNANSNDVQHIDDGKLKDSKINVYNPKKTRELVNKLRINKDLEDDEFKYLLSMDEAESISILRDAAREVTNEHYSNKVYVRGLVEFSNICSQNCYYCGIRSGNQDIERFRLTVKDMLSAVDSGYEIGFRTFVFQGGEDPKFTDDVFEEVISKVKSKYPDSAITLSIGVRSYESYKRLKEAGADRFLLRHETADEGHFSYLHPSNQSFEQRKRALYDIKKLGYAVGTGIMVGSPKQKIDYIVKDLKFMRQLEPDMIGIGPFIPHKSSKFKDIEHGDMYLTLKMLSILRLMFPLATIPSTTALNTIDSEGRIRGIMHGANVIMPNLSPDNAKRNYNLYDNKKISGKESADYVRELNEYLMEYGYEIDFSRGDPLTIKNK